jgi:N-acetylneuraminic acid mutarotase
MFLAVSCLFNFPGAGKSVVFTDSWETMRPMPTARQGLGAAAVNGKIYAIGGGSDLVSSVVYGTNEMYNPAANSWIAKQPMPTPRFGFGIAACGNKIYVMGGYRESGGFPASSNEAYDPATDTWTTLKEMPTPRGNLHANAVDGKIYLIGGKDLGATDLNEVYDIATDTWTTKQPIPKAVMSYASAVVDGKIYILGGYPHPDSVQIYDPATDSWSMGATPPSGLHSSCAAATTGVYAPERIYVLGGADIYSLGDNLVYDPKSDSWSIGNAMPTPRGLFGLAVVNDFLYAIGGTGARYVDPPVREREVHAHQLRNAASQGSGALP